METGRPYNVPDTSLTHFLLPIQFITQRVEQRRWNSEQEGCIPPSTHRKTQSSTEISDLGFPLNTLRHFNFLSEEMLHPDYPGAECCVLSAARHRPCSLTLFLPVHTVDALQIGHGFAYL